MEKAYLEELLHKYKNGTLSSAEQLELDNWYLAEARLASPLTDPVVFSSRLAELDEAFPFSAVKEIKRVRLWPRIAVAAAVATVIFGAGLFYYSNQVTKSGQASVVVVQDVLPGKAGATLTLASGKKIVLSDALNGKLAEEAGVNITKTAEGELLYEIVNNSEETNKINTLSTAKGETYRLRLPDGSMVWLNAASSLKYPASFAALKERRVDLTGEGYFEIAKDRAHPFIVNTESQQVEVLGTQFNVNAYSDEPSTKTTLLEGSVKVKANNGTIQTIKPDQQSILSGSGLKVIPVVAETYIDWKEGSINFRKEELSSIMRKVSRWYNVEVEYQGISDDGQTFTGYVSRTGNVSIVLDALGKISDFKFKITGNKITVSK